MYRFEIEKVGKGYLGVLFKGDKKNLDIKSCITSTFGDY